MGFMDYIWGKDSTSNPIQHNRDVERQQRLLRYEKTWEAYLAELEDPIIGDPRAPEVNDNVKVNPARALVNVSVYFLFGNTPSFEISPESIDQYGTGGSTPASVTTDTDTINSNQNPDWLQALNKAWKANRKESLLYNLGLSGGIHGDVFIKIVPNGAGMRNEFPRLVLLDPASVDVVCDPNDYDRVLKYCIEYTIEGPDGEPMLKIQEISANVDSNDVTQSWTIQNYLHRMEWAVGSGWVPGRGLKEPDGPPELWDYPWPPIEHCQNIEVPHQFWGLPDLDNASVEVIKTLQRSMSSLNKIVRIHASPRMFAKNVMPDQVADIDVSADNIITLPNMDAEMSVLQTLNNLSPSIQFTDKLREDLYEMLQVPPIALGRFESASTSISGVTLSILYAPIIQKTELKQISYGDMLLRLNHKILELMGYTEHDEHEGLVIVWPENMPGSAYLNRQTLMTDNQLGASTYTTLEKLGYDPVEEEARRSAEMEHELSIQSKYAVQSSPSTDGEETRGGNNNPAGGNKVGSMGGVKSAGVSKNPQNNRPNEGAY